jgi:hypothetical protein
MDFFFWVLVAGLLFLFYSRVTRFPYSKTKEIRMIFHEYSSELGLIETKSTFLIDPHVCGKIGEQTIDIKTGKENGFRCIIIELRPPIKSYYKLILNAISAFLEKKQPAKSNSCDAKFDSLIRTTGNDPSTLAAILDDKTRDTIRNLFKRTWAAHIDYSAMIMKYRLDFFIEHHTYIGDSIRRFAAVGIKLYSPLFEKQWLIDNAAHSTLSGVRANNLLQLLTLPSFDDDCRKAFERALGDHSVDVVCTAVTGLGEAYADRIMPFLDDSSADARKMAVTCIASVSKEIDSKHFIAYFKKEISMDVRIAILDMFGKLGQKNVQPFLFRTAHSGNEEESIHALEALSHCGDMSAVEHLHRIASDPGADSSVQKAARNSIAAIQERFGKTDKGLVSIEPVNAEDGALSIVKKDTEGSISNKSERGDER